MKGSGIFSNSTCKAFVPTDGLAGKSSPVNENKPSRESEKDGIFS
jgi:hypothetical protein